MKKVKNQIHNYLAAFFLLLLSCIETGWTEVLDDDGKMITEAEIEANMEIGYRTGCCLGGGLSSTGIGLAVGWLAWFGICADETTCSTTGGNLRSLGIGLITAGGIVAIGTTTSYYIGKHLDRRSAINRIKAQHRQQKENAFGEQDVTNGFYFRLLKGTF